jgi:hypothetical protein
MAHQPITAPPEPQVTHGLGAAVGVGVHLLDDDPLDPERRWRQGYAMEGPSCGLTYTGDPCDHLSRATFSPLVQSVVGQPFIIGAGVSCSSFGSPKALGPWHAAADRMLDLCRWRGIAHELWTGTQAAASGWPNRYLADGDGYVLGTDLSPLAAVAAIEDAFGACKCGAGRVIHVPTRLVPYLDELGIVHAQGARLFTALGTLVVADDGYPGTGPVGEPPLDPGVLWVYATSTIGVRIDSEVLHPEPDWEAALRARDNTIEVRSEQLVMASWLCCHYAVNVRYC